MRKLCLFTLLMLSPYAYAYIGPGAGIPILGSVIGIIVTIVLVISAILFWPIRKALKKRKKDQDTGQ